MITNEPIVQVYRGGFSGSSDPAVRRAKLARAIEKFNTSGVRTFGMHGGPRELVQSWDGLARMGADLGVQLVAAWGLDGESDTDGTKLTGAEKGACMAAVLKESTCLAGLADAEGRWDDADQLKPGDVTDKDDALAMGEALRDPCSGAPNALVGDQCWFAIDSHGSLRARVPAGDPRDVFAGFPVDEFARKVVNWFQFRQAYCNNFKQQWGRQRYAKVFAWMNRDWALLEEPFKKAGLHYNPGVTIQAYGWEDIPADLSDCLIRYMGTLQQPLIAWWEPDTDPGVYCAAVRFYTFLLSHGYITPGRDPRDTVLAYQRDYNKTAIVKIDEDGRAGYKTWKSAGIEVEPWPPSR